VVVAVWWWPGRDFFGELALLYNAPRAATVTAVTPCIAWALDRVTFKAIMQDSAMKQRSLYTDIIDRVPILSSLSAYEKLQLADAFKARSYGAGDVIIRQGEVRSCISRAFGHHRLTTDPRRRATSSSLWKTARWCAPSGLLMAASGISRMPWSRARTLASWPC
jgi:hypothetical protein